MLFMNPCRRVDEVDEDGDEHDRITPRRLTSTRIIFINPRRLTSTRIIFINTRRLSSTRILFLFVVVMYVLLFLLL